MAKEDLADRDGEYAVICIASGMLFLTIAKPFEAVIFFYFMPHCYTQGGLNVMDKLS